MNGLPPIPQTDPRPDRHRDAVVVVTGGASGIGLACAELLCTEGARVIVADINAAAAEDAASSIGTNDRIIGLPVDVRSAEGCGSLIAQTISLFGGVTGLVHAAGVNQPKKPIVEFDDAEWQRVLEINLTGTLNVIRAIGPHLGRGGAIVTLASGAGRVARPGAAAYCVSKAGVLMLTKVAALELGPQGVRVNSIAPGFINTPMNQAKFSGDGLEKLERAAPLKRVGEAYEIATVASFLLSSESSFVTGDLIAVDGGVAAPSRT